MKDTKNTNIRTISTMSTGTFLEQAVFTAIWKGNLNGVKTLVDSKNLECFDQENHRTPLSWSCYYGNKQITPYLLELGA
ncbi:hypothetical protein ABTM83_20115, partial [Acinetobacter baumannii]